MANAEVACRELGYRHAESTYSGSLLGDSTPYTKGWVQNVRCRGNEDAFYQCNNNGYQYLQCDYLGLDVTGINCTSELCSKLEKHHHTQCIEVLTCCSLQAHTHKNSSILYRNSNVVTKIIARYILINQIESYTYPITRTLVQHYVTHPDSYQYSTFFLITDYEPQMSLRLTGGSDNSEGLVIVTIDGTDGMICGDGWSLTNAEVVCRQLGYATALRTFTGEDFGENPGLMWMSYVTCSGNESDIQNCTHAGFDKNTYCSHAVGVAVICGGV